MKKLITIIFLIFTISFSISINASEKLFKYEKNIIAFNSYVEITLKSTNDIKNIAENIFNNSTNIIKKYNYLTNNYTNKLDDSIKDQIKIKKNLFDINQMDFNIDIEVEKELYDILYFADCLISKTNNYYNFSIGKIIDLWKEKIDKYSKKEIPEKEYLELINKLDKISVTTKPLIFKTINNKYYINKTTKDVKLDLGATTKGYVSDIIYNLIKKENIKEFIINSGQSSIIVGKKNTNKPYTIIIEPPIENGILDKQLFVEDTSISTSGNYLQYFLYKNIRQHHIISPLTKMPATNFHTLTIIGDNYKELDSISTALFSMNKSQINKFSKENNIKYSLYNIDDNKTYTNINTISSIDQYRGGINLSGQKYIPQEKSNTGIIIITISFSIISLVLLGLLIFLFLKNKKINKLIKDLLVIGLLFFILIGSYLIYNFWPRKNIDKIEILYKGDKIVEVYFGNLPKILKKQTDTYPIIKKDNNNYIIVLLGDYKINNKQQEVHILIDNDKKGAQILTEKSPHNYCSYQGFSNRDSIVCLPNQIIIKFITDQNNEVWILK